MVGLELAQTATASPFLSATGRWSPGSLLAAERYNCPRTPPTSSTYRGSLDQVDDTLMEPGRVVEVGTDVPVTPAPPTPASPRPGNSPADRGQPSARGAGPRRPGAPSRRRTRIHLRRSCRHRPAPRARRHCRPVPRPQPHRSGKKTGVLAGTGPSTSVRTVASSGCGKGFPSWQPSPHGTGRQVRPQPSALSTRPAGRLCSSSLIRRASWSWSSRMTMRQAASTGVPWSTSSRARAAMRNW